MGINWKIRFKNPVFIIQILVAIFTPVLAYMGIKVQDLTSWSVLGNLVLSAVANPYVVGLMILNFLNIINDPTTKGISDSAKAKNYTKLG